MPQFEEVKKIIESYHMHSSRLTVVCWHYWLIDWMLSIWAQTMNIFFLLFNKKHLVWSTKATKIICSFCKTCFDGGKVWHVYLVGSGYKQWICMEYLIRYCNCRFSLRKSFFSVAEWFQFFCNIFTPASDSFHLQVTS